MTSDIVLDNSKVNLYHCAVFGDLDTLRTEVWTLDQLVVTANRLLPDYLPKESSGRTVEDVNPRLVRHYTTAGLLPEPRKDGREARYLFDHLLHLLVVRRLLAEGLTSGAIKRVLEGVPGPELERLLAGGVRIEVVPERPEVVDDAKADFLKRLRTRAGLAAPPVESSQFTTTTLRSMADSTAPMRPPEPTQQPNAASPFRHVDWSRIALLDGLELHVREDFRLPTYRLGDEQIAQLVKAVLLDLEQRRKGRS
jgi:DNA-binding transcriptional MerR regulator